MSATPKEKKKHHHGGKEHHGKDSPKASTTGPATGVIKAAGGRKGGDGASTAGGRGTGGGESKSGGPTEKGILKNKKGTRTKGGEVKGKNAPVKAKHKPKPKKKSLFEKVALNMGFYVGDVQLQDPWAIEAAQALDLQQWHLRRLKLRFDKIDLDGSGNIDYDEFFESIGEVRSPFTDKLFALIDLDGSGTIEFDEYVRVMATYCMFTKDEILRFCFECFDVDKSGTIDEKEFVELCKCINNASPSFPGNFKKALEEFDVNEDGLIDYSEFGAIDARYPLVLFPAFRLQDVMQRNSLGECASVSNEITLLLIWLLFIFIIPLPLSAQ
mmetsp:Transcript_32101/g.54133  ORF Transcript_32101/g.54133 Transcript_32101/m.54133 type:complete len:327 (+) Transcript_32101:235-1215(+)